ncbi:MAG: trigger factor [Firmicutes bacterium]|nr:trigger factor [Bacillota bacterium]
MEKEIKRGKGEVNFTFTVSADEWKSALEAAYKAEAAKYRVEGFRKGKAPRGVIEKQYGPVFFEPALTDTFYNAYREMVKAEKIDVVGRPEVDFDELDDGGIVIRARVEVVPPFELGKYKGHNVKKTKATVAEKDVEAYMERMRQSRARQVEAKEGAKLAKGDIAIIDFVGSVDGTEFAGGRASDYELEIGSGSFIDTFEDQLVGKKLGENVRVNVKFPDNYHASELAGKPALFVVDIKKIMQREIPTLDDRFVREISEFDTVEAFRNDVRARLTSQAEMQAKANDEHEVVKTVIEASKFTAPASLVERQIDAIIQDMEFRLMQQGVGIEGYLQYVNKSMDDFRNEQRKNADSIVRTRLVFDKIQDAEGFEITEAEIKAEAQKVADAAGRKVAEILKSPDRVNYIENDLMYTKIVSFLLANNKLV